MSKLMTSGQCRTGVQICVAGAVAALLSGCSSDTTRFSDPFGNPFSLATNTTVKPQHTAALTRTIPAGRTPPVVAQALPTRQTVVAAAAPVHVPGPVAVSQVSGETTGSIEPRTVPGASFGGWSGAGGAAIVVAQGETADVLAKRYGVPEHAFLQVNGLSGAGQVQPGARLVVPIYNAVATGPAVAASLAHPLSHPPIRIARAAGPVPPRAAATIVAVSPRLAAGTPGRGTRIVKGPLGKTSVAAVQPKTGVRQALISPARQMKGAVLPRTAGLVAQPSKVPGAPPIGKTGSKNPQPRVAGPAPSDAVRGDQVAAVERKAVDPMPTASVAPQIAATPPAGAAAGEGGGNAEFRWPARGRIIQSFKGGAGGNDGINIAVPEGTAVKAAEGGVVAYAGSELKGYGNLVLIRHPNGFVSAYANNGEIDVKRGDTVKRGQTIAKSGQTGNVSSPQLHFELRKGSQPVDPTGYLAGL